MTMTISMREKVELQKKKKNEKIKQFDMIIAYSIRLYGTYLILCVGE